MEIETLETGFSMVTIKSVGISSALATFQAKNNHNIRMDKKEYTKQQSYNTVIDFAIEKQEI